MLQYHHRTLTPAHPPPPLLPSFSPLPLLPFPPYSPSLSATLLRENVTLALVKSKVLPLVEGARVAKGTARQSSQTGRLESAWAMYQECLKLAQCSVSMSRKDRAEIQQLRGEAASSAALVAAKIGRTRSKEMQTMVATARSAMQASRTQQVGGWV